MTWPTGIVGVCLKTIAALLPILGVVATMTATHVTLWAGYRFFWLYMKHPRRSRSFWRNWYDELKSNWNQWLAEVNGELKVRGL